MSSIPNQLDSLFKEIHSSKIVEIDTVNNLARMHAQFEQIHPFADGNGRVGRILMFALAIKHNVMPPLITRAKRAAYYKYLEIAQTKVEQVEI